MNPEIVERTGEAVDEEGCLSIPGLAYPVTRSEHVLVRGLDADGEPIELEADDYIARILQHEIDHLDGVLFIDRIDPDLRREALRLIRERAVNGAPTPIPRTPERASVAPMRIVFMGTPSAAVPSLRAIADASEVIAVYTRPDRPRAVVLRSRNRP